MQKTSKEFGPTGLSFGLPPEGDSILFPPCGSLLEWWSIGVMKKLIHVKLGLSFFPTLQYSSIPQRLEPVPAKLLSSDLVLRARFSLLNITISKNYALTMGSHGESKISCGKKTPP
jgi:hypothetical protein